MEVIYKTLPERQRETARTLYECSHARVCGSSVYCVKGYYLSKNSHNGKLDINRLARGKPLALAICQDCSDFESMGPPVPDDEKGWLDK